MKADKQKVTLLLKTARGQLDGLLTVSYTHLSTLRTPEDYESYLEDTMRAGHYKNNPDSVAVMIRSSPQIT